MLILALCTLTSFTMIFQCTWLCADEGLSVGTHSVAVVGEGVTSGSVIDVAMFQIRILFIIASVVLGLLDVMIFLLRLYTILSWDGPISEMTH